MEYRSLNSYMKERFGCKVYKLAINGGFTCPNRDGTIDTRGCIFCSGYGSGDFAEDSSLSVTEQIERGKKRVEAKMPKKVSEAEGKYIAYFQAFTNTYASVERLRKLFMEAINHPDVVVLSIATRPDCLPDDVLALLSELNDIKPVWVELGLQTIHEKSAEYIRRGYPLQVYEDAVRNLRERNIEVITHVILGLPGETKEDMLRTVKYVGSKIKSDSISKMPGTRIGEGDDEKTCDSNDCEYRVQGIKLQLLHVIEGTDLALDYKAGKFECLELDEYVGLIKQCIEVLPDDMVIHRMTGDGAKKTLVAPLWSADKKRVLNALNKGLGVV